MNPSLVSTMHVTRHHIVIDQDRQDCTLYFFAYIII